MSIKQKFFGNLQLDNLGKAVKTIPSKVDKTEKYGHQIKVKGTMWEDGGITIDIWDAENKVAHKLGKLMVDKEFVKPTASKDPVPAPTTQESDPDLPF
ncbi:MAG TPA: hypothetical protein DEG69_23795 [Flavobacteriaceae bacterium]|nr:hypothetical protein [Flavobacteriaceae bacterium]